MSPRILLVQMLEIIMIKIQQLSRNADQPDNVLQECQIRSQASTWNHCLNNQRPGKIVVSGKQTLIFKIKKVKLFLRLARFLHCTTYCEFPPAFLFFCHLYWINIWKHPPHTWSDTLQIHSLFEYMF